MRFSGFFEENIMCLYYGPTMRQQGYMLVTSSFVHPPSAWLRQPSRVAQHRLDRPPSTVQNDDGRPRRIWRPTSGVRWPWRLCRRSSQACRVAGTQGSHEAAWHMEDLGIVPNDGRIQGGFTKWQSGTRNLINNFEVCRPVLSGLQGEV